MVPKPLDACSGKFVEGGACGCVEVCYGGRHPKDGYCGVHIRIMAIFCRVYMNVLDMYWPLEVMFVMYFVDMVMCGSSVMLGEEEDVVGGKLRGCQRGFLHVFICLPSLTHVHKF